MNPAPSQAPLLVDPRELHRLRQAGAPCDLLDVRTSPEYAEAHVPGARLVPLDQLDAEAFLAQRADRNAPLYVICQSGARAAKAAAKLRAAGADHCLLVEGGTQAWIDAGLPVERRASRVLPLLRQVHLAVGFFTALGAVLALTVDSRFAILPLITGCGMLVHGSTGWCGMALLLAKMPWNRASASVEQGSAATAGAEV